MDDITLTNLVGGVESVPSGSEHSTLIDPCTGLSLGTAPVTLEPDVHAAFEAALKAFDGWAATPPRDRSERLLACAAAFEQRREEIVDAECLETGAPRAFVREQMVDAAIDAFRFYSGCPRSPRSLGSGEYLTGVTSSVRHEAIGVCAQIGTWNYPSSIAAWHVAPALAAGNTTVFKPARTTPASALLLAEIAREFLPPGVFNVVCGDRRTAEAMVSDPIPRLVSLAGSTSAGLRAALSAMPDFKHLVLGLGGKSAAIVFDDAGDPRALAHELLKAAYINGGQDCTAASRVLVEQTIAAELTRELASQAPMHRPGPPSEPGSAYGPLNTLGQLERVQDLLRRIPSGAEVLAGGRRLGERGHFFEATVVSGVAQDDELVQEEVFGPVLTVQTFASEEEALALANGVRFGIAASVWTADQGRVLRLQRRLDCGCVWINTHAAVATEMPHGGFKQSGFGGKELSIYGFEPYVRIKHVMSAAPLRSVQLAG